MTKFSEVLLFLLCLVGGAIAGIFILAAVALYIFHHDLQGLISFLEWARPIAVVIGAVAAGVAYLVAKRRFGRRKLSL